MGRLAGFKYREVIRRMRARGFVMLRHGHGSHEVWANEATGGSFTISHHPGDISEGTLRGILEQAGIKIADFLA